MSLQVLLIENQSLLKAAHEIRYKVFVEEQNVPAEAELDAFEKDSRHFLAMDEDRGPCGTARWRFTEQGIKLERFAVLKEHRKMGVGSALLSKVLEDIAKHPGYSQNLIYLHAQLDAIPLYRKYGFRITGKLFKECDIDHYKMTMDHT